MSRKVTIKTIQVHEQCSCGRNDVYKVKEAIAFKDLADAGSRYKKDATTGEPLFIQNLSADCPGQDAHLERDIDNDF